MNKNILCIIAAQVDLNTFLNLLKINSAFYECLHNDEMYLDIIKFKYGKNIIIEFELACFEIYVYCQIYDLDLYHGKLIEKNLLNYVLSVNMNVAIEDKPHFEYTIEVLENDDPKFLEFQIEQIEDVFGELYAACFINVHVHLIGRNCLKYLRTENLGCNSGYYLKSSSYDIKAVQRNMLKEINTRADYMFEIYDHKQHYSDHTGPFNVITLISAQKFRSYESSYGTFNMIYRIFGSNDVIYHMSPRGLLSYTIDKNNTVMCVVTRNNKIDYRKRAKIRNYYYRLRGLITK